MGRIQSIPTIVLFTPFFSIFFWCVFRVFIPCFSVFFLMFVLMFFHVSYPSQQVWTIPSPDAAGRWEKKSGHADIIQDQSLPYFREVWTHEAVYGMAVPAICNHHVGFGWKKWKETRDLKTLKPILFLD
jgi:hypothetical protein